MWGSCCVRSCAHAGRGGSGNGVSWLWGRVRTLRGVRLGGLLPTIFTPEWSVNKHAVHCGVIGSWALDLFALRSWAYSIFKVGNDPKKIFLFFILGYDLFFFLLSMQRRIHEKAEGFSLNLPFQSIVDSLVVNSDWVLVSRALNLLFKTLFCFLLGGGRGAAFCPNLGNHVYPKGWCPSMSCPEEKPSVTLWVSFPGGTSGKESTCQCRRCKRRGFDPWVGKIRWRRAWQPTPVSLPGVSHGQRSLVAYSPWGRKESDTTEAF